MSGYLGYDNLEDVHRWQCPVCPDTWRQTCSPKVLEGLIELHERVWHEIFPRRKP